MSGSLGTPANTIKVFHWVIAWFAASLNPDTLNQYHFYGRKAVHFTCYGILTLLWFRALMISRPGRLYTNIIAALALSLAVAAADEGRQFTVTTRTPSLWDIGLDLTGGIVFLSLFAAGWKMWKRQHAPAPPPPP
jgi:VanZ family protein